MNTKEMWRTNDMGCAAFLVMGGHTFQGCEFIEDTCYWFFVPCPTLYEQLEAWTGSEGVLMNPREYNKVYGTIKNSFHKALDASRK